MTIIRKYNLDNCPWGLPKHRDTPAPTDYVYSKKNRPQTEEEKSTITKKFPNLDFWSAVCSLLHLAFGSRADILFITCKLAKACSEPGLIDFQDLLWLFGYLRDVYEVHTGS
jgi:hypothetical protein